MTKVNKIEELVHNYSHWDSTNDEFTYKSIIDIYLDGIKNSRKLSSELVKIIFECAGKEIFG